MASDALRLNIYSIRPVLSDDHVHPVADTLSDIYGVQPLKKSTDHEPVAAEFQEVALYIFAIFSALGGPGLVTKFFEPLVTEAGERFRDRVFQDVVKEVDSRGPDARRYAPFGIGVGISDEEEYPRVPVHYIFHGEIDDVELLRRLRAADLHLKSIPEELLRDAPIGPPGRFFWDPEQGGWRGYISRFPDDPAGEVWFPPDLME